VGDDGFDDLRQQVCLSLRMTLAYVENHAHLRELFTLQEMLSRHAADVAWHQSQQEVGPLPKASQEMPAVLRDQLAEMERQKQAMTARQQVAPNVLIHGTSYAPEP
jgi:hypothetical protein